MDYNEECAVAIRLSAVATPSCPCHMVNLAVLDAERHLSVMPVPEIQRLIRLGSQDLAEARGSEAIEAQLPQPANADWDPDFEWSTVDAARHMPVVPTLQAACAPSMTDDRARYAGSLEGGVESPAGRPLVCDDSGRISAAGAVGGSTSDRAAQERRLVATVHGVCNETWGSDYD